ncbi:hypothetical protein BW13_08040 [Bifidobacterium sp. UTCIF-37]|uniref:DUF3073 domain-containing protein n=1 Tax=unclassified Bifidobacterium TaxID=2608897 RepID=UPI00112B2973|nr:MULTISPECIES: DUF3073 domain-containing protein [unclassified Bifidobacterium]TPF85907.1 hypothetical protein BW13_08040 [Bifidobacterium sp. UTCIF-37]TPF89228.1 hypothetical protein BW11_05725 [Bifidobacterium sp. UTCIF-38]
MGRGRQKAKQQKIARKLKYLTTDTDYDELAKELSGQEPGTGSVDPFADVEDQYSSRYADETSDAAVAADSSVSADADDADRVSGASAQGDDDLDEYAKWAAEAAAKATSGEFPKASKTSAKPVPHKPIPMPMPSALKPHKA